MTDRETKLLNWAKEHADVCSVCGTVAENNSGGFQTTADSSGLQFVCDNCLSEQDPELGAGFEPAMSNELVLFNPAEFGPDITIAVRVPVGEDSGSVALQVARDIIENHPTYSKMRLSFSHTHRIDFIKGRFA
jgi:hypothetical protein